MNQLKPIHLTHAEPFALGNATVVPDARLIETADGETIRLEPRAMQVLVALYQASGHTLSHDDLIETCWDGQIVGDNAISRIISQLRKALGAAGDIAEIETVPRVGYRLEAGESTAIEQQSARQPPLPPAQKPGPWKAVLIGIITVLAMALIYFKFNDSTPAAGDGRIAIAVMPLDSIDDEGRLLGEGFAGELRSELGRHPAFRVLGRNSTLALRAGDETQPGFGLDYFLEGQVKEEGEQLSFRLSLIDADNGETVWSEAYKGKADESLDLQDAATNGIVDYFALARRADGKPADRTHKHARYLIAMALIMDRGTESVVRAKSLLDDLTRQSPEYPQGWSAHAMASALAGGYSSEAERRDELYRIAHESVERALALDPDLASAYAVRGFLLDNQARFPQEAHAALRRAVDLNPDDSQAWYWLSNHYFAQGDAKAAMEAAYEVLRIDPLWIHAQRAVDLAEAFGSHETARKLREQTSLRHPEPHIRHMAQAQIAAGKGDWSEAIRSIDRAIETSGTSSNRRSLQFTRLTLFTLLDVEWDRPLDPFTPAPIARMVKGEPPLRPDLDEEIGTRFPLVISSDGLMMEVFASGQCPLIIDEAHAQYDTGSGSQARIALEELPWLALCDDTGSYRTVAAKFERTYDGLYARGALAAMSLGDLAKVKAGLGKQEEAIALLLEARDAGWPNFLPTTSFLPFFSPRLRGNPVYAPLEGDPRFERLADEIEANIGKERAETIAYLAERGAAPTP